eukprot:364339-Chlamydomonas_euryale.AAC.6
MATPPPPLAPPPVLPYCHRHTYRTVRRTVRTARGGGGTGRTVQPCRDRLMHQHMHDVQTLTWREGCLTLLEENAAAARARSATPPQQLAQRKRHARFHTGSLHNAFRAV